MIENIRLVIKSNHMDDRHKKMKDGEIYCELMHGICNLGDCRKCSFPIVNAIKLLSGKI